MIQEGWKTYKLSELCTKITDGSHFSPNVSLVGTKMIATVRDMTEYGFHFDQCKRISDEDYQELVRNGCNPKKGDVLFSKDGTIGLVQYVKEDLDLVLLSSIAIFSPNKGKIDGQFLAYCLKNPTTKKNIKDNYKSGSAIPRIVLKDFKKLELEIPVNIATQSRIASILSSLDDKIELNLQMNKTLEAIAQAIFKEWFVDFRFPGFDGEFVDGLPKGWEKSTIGSIAKNIQYGYTESSSREVIGPKFLRITDIQLGSVDWSQVPYCSISEKEFEKYKIKDHDIFIARTGASTGENIYVIESPSAVFASYLIRVQFEKPEYAFFIGKFLRREVYFNYIASSLGGSAQPNANAKTLTNIETVIPENTILKNYFALVFPLQKKIVHNQNENQILTQLRDSLLPKLMTSKIRVA